MKIAGHYQVKQLGVQLSISVLNPVPFKLRFQQGTAQLRPVFRMLPRSVREKDEGWRPERKAHIPAGG